MIRQATIVQAFVLAIVPVLLAAAFAPSLAPKALAGIALLALLRLSWLDDNIANDLIDQKVLPASYVNTVRRRQRIAWQLFGLSPQLDPKDQNPALVATAFRAEAHAILSALLTGAAMSAALHAPPVTGVVGLALLLPLAFKQCDRLASALLHLESGRPLSRDRLLCKASWAMSAVAPEDDD